MALPERLPVPAYGRAALSDLLPAVLASLGVPGEADALELPPARRAVVLLVDGLGSRLLARARDAAPFLSSLAQRTLTAGFPTTTATSLASLGTGLTPGEHGVTGYTSVLDEVGTSVAWLTWTSAPVLTARAAPRGDAGQDLRERLVPEQMQPRPTAFERAAAAGVAVTVAAPAAYEGSGLTHAVLRGGRHAGAVTPGDALAHVVAASRLGERSLAYCYTPDLDLTGHVRGVAGPAWVSQLRLVDAFAEQLAAALPPGVALHVTGDHGMVDVPEQARVDADRVEALQEGVRALAGDPRARHVHCEPGASDDVHAAWTAELGAGWEVLRRDEVVAAGLLGPRVAERHRSRIGDLVAVATGLGAVVRSQAEPQLSRLRGQHGALTDDELLVPLLTSAG